MKRIMAMWLLVAGSFSSSLYGWRTPEERMLVAYIKISHIRDSDLILNSDCYGELINKSLYHGYEIPTRYRRIFKRLGLIKKNGNMPQHVREVLLKKFLYMSDVELCTTLNKDIDE